MAEHRNRKGIPEQVMLGMLVSKGNLDKACTTADTFGRAVGKEIALLLQTDDLDRRADPFRSFLLAQSNQWKDVWLWDKESDERCRWDSSLPAPFFHGAGSFSYGSALNRLLLLSLVAGNSNPILVRIDAGTEPVNEFTLAAELIEHIGHLGANYVVSGRYDARLALRGVNPDEQEAYFDLIRNRVGVDPNRQITGGACLTLGARSGPPAICFPGFTPCWASDDGFFESVTDRCVFRSEMVVRRTDKGQPLEGPEYSVRLASAATLAHIHLHAGMIPNRIPTRESVLTAGHVFLRELASVVPYALTSADLPLALTMLKERVPNIIAGYKNYVGLKERWREVCTEVLTLAPILKAHCQVSLSVVPGRL